jgi:hypothetical protein
LGMERGGMGANRVDPGTEEVKARNA